MSQYVYGGGKNFFVHTKIEIKQKNYQPSYLVNVLNAYWNKGISFSKHKCLLHFIGLSGSINKVLLRVNLIIYHTGMVYLVSCMVIYSIKNL